MKNKLFQIHSIDSYIDSLARRTFFNVKISIDDIDIFRNQQILDLITKGEITKEDILKMALIFKLEETEEA